MNEIHQAALEDLERLKPETWVEVWGKRLCDLIKQREQDTLRYANQQMNQAAEVRAGATLSVAVSTALGRWEKGCAQPGKTSLRVAAKLGKALAQEVGEARSEYLRVILSRIPPAPAVRPTPGQTEEQRKNRGRAAKVALSALLEGIPDDVDSEVAAKFKATVTSLLTNPVVTGELSAEEFEAEVKAADGEPEN